MNIIIYSQNGTVVDGVVGQYRNPDFFENTNDKAQKVVLVGDYPYIKQAYEAIGIVVEQHQTQNKAKTSGEAKPKTGKTKQPPANEQPLPPDGQ